MPKNTFSGKKSDFYEYTMNSELAGDAPVIPFLNGFG